jgi:pimeloyl-ACP methyl ester carboxylesterase
VDLIALRKSFVQAWAVKSFDVWSESSEKNLFESVQVIKCPVYFFAGEKDYNTNYSVTQDYFNFVSATKKNLFLFQEAGHGLPETHPGLFQDMIIEKILPETFN